MPVRRRRIAFLLSQLGSDASAAFEQAVSALGVTASEAGLLRLIGQSPGISQRAASTQLGVGPSRVVAVLDHLEAAGYIERRRSAVDRRSHELRLTRQGGRVLADLRPIAEAHERSFTAGLDDGDLDRLASCLEALVAARGLGKDVHRGTGPDKRDSPRPTGETAVGSRSSG